MSEPHKHALDAPVEEVSAFAVAAVQAGLEAPCQDPDYVSVELTQQSAVSEPRRRRQIHPPPPDAAEIAFRHQRQI